MLLLNALKLLILCAILITVNVVVLNYQQYLMEQELECFDAILFATKEGAGLGNVFFELVSLIGLYARFNRSIVFTDKGTNRAVQETLEMFPWMKYFFNRFNKTVCGPPSVFLTTFAKCCTLDRQLFSNTIMDRRDKSTIKLNLHYAQSYMYFSTFAPGWVDQLAEGTKHTRKQAMYQLYRNTSMRVNKTNLCVHVRRGDFLRSNLTYASDYKFTIDATKYLHNKIKKETNKTADLYFMSIEYQWLTDKIKPIFKNAFYPHIFERTPNIDWEFSRLYCDVVLLTASASTYGWWLARVSRGKEVYYNSNYSTPGGIETELEEDSFFPFTWNKMTHNRTTNTFVLS